MRICEDLFFISLTPVYYSRPSITHKYSSFNDRYINIDNCNISQHIYRNFKFVNYHIVMVKLSCLCLLFHIERRSKVIRKKLLALIMAIVMILPNTMVAFAADDRLEKNSSSEISEEINVSTTWTSEDFTYGSYEKLLYGCDYARQINIKGVAITGFSETGEKKLATNKDLVLPAVDDEGISIVGVAERAFYSKGLTSVKFPTGMMVDYDDTVTNRVTKRGNFIIADSAFANNNLTSVNLPEGVIACLPSAFNNNKITTVKLPRTIWWLETLSFANNRITTVNFPTTCDFQLEMHGMAFAKNFIKSVRLPDFTEVVNKDVFTWNTGCEPIAADAKDSYKKYKVDGVEYDAGVVYMYADNAELEAKDRIHHSGKATAAQYSYVQKLIINDGTPETQNPYIPWNIDDFIIEGTVVKGLSESGIAKRATNKNLIIPDINSNWQYITEIASAPAGENGLFGSETEGFDTVELPNELKKIGNFAFQNCGITEVVFPARLEEIGTSAFQNNLLTSVILPDTVTTLGNGAFATNPLLERISISKGLTEIPTAAFGCSDAKNYMTNLTSIEIPEGIASIGANAFAGNNFHNIVIPVSVKTIGNYAFSTKNYLKGPCTVTLNEGLETIGADAFRNKVIEEITLPKTVKKIDKNTFRKEYSDGDTSVITKVYVSLKEQYEDTKNFPTSDYHKIYLTDTSVWTPEDFNYAQQNFTLYPAEEYSSTPNFNVLAVTGLSEIGEHKITVNKSLVIPDKDPSGRKVQGIGDNAFKSLGITSLTLPEDVKADHDDTIWNTTGKGVTERGDFFIGASAFLGNTLISLDLPDGVIYIGNNAFKGNSLTSVRLPESLMFIGNSSFAQNSISSVDFPERTDFNFQIDNMAFAINSIKAVQLPENTEKVTKWAFLQNTGMEPVITGNANEKKGGIVYMYKAEAGGSLIEDIGNGKSNVQKLIEGTIPPIDAPWGVSDFTYDTDETTITGLSTSGKDKIKSNPTLLLPKAGPSGKTITALGDGATNIGIFNYTEGGKNFTPASILLPETLEKIGKFTFALNPNITYEAEMTSINLPDGLKEIGLSSFQNTKLTSVSIPDSVTVMGNGAFTGCGNLTSIKLSKNVVDIPQAAFNAGTSALMKLESLVIPEGVKTIGNNAFTGTHIENLTLPSTLISIGNAAFQNHQLTTLEIPASVKSIGNTAFKITQEGLKASLQNLILHEGLETIGKEAFMGNSIISVDLPGTVKLSHINKANDSIFGNDKTPTNPIVILKTSNKTLVEECNTEYASNYSHKVIYDKLVGTGWTEADFTYDEETGTITGWSVSGNTKRKTIKALVLPDKTPGGKDIVAIGDEAFKIPDDEVIITKFGIESPNGMTSVVLPSKLTKIGNKSFAQNGLVNIDLNDKLMKNSVKSFAQNAIVNTDSNGLTSIGISAFYGNKLTKVEIPDTVTELGEGAFSANDITDLKLSAGVTKIPQGAFSMNIRLSQITIPDTVTEIGDNAFAGARLTSLIIPESVVKIGTKAFHLHHLTTLTIPGNVKEIGESAFEGTYKATTLKELIIEEGVEIIGKYAFKEALLETVHLPDSIKAIGEEPFCNNKGKDGSHIVEVTTNNPALAKLTDSTFKVKFIGTYSLEDYKDQATLSYSTADYTGSMLKPVVTIAGLEEGIDYEVAYTNNINVGTATVTITGKGNYKGTIIKTFTITPKSDSKQPQEGSEGPKPDNRDESTPQTGDNSNMLLWIVLILISSGVLVTDIYKKKRHAA